MLIATEAIFNPHMGEEKANRGKTAKDDGEQRSESYDGS